jgi:hypothetical protein
MTTRLEFAEDLQKALDVTPYDGGNLALINLMVGEGATATDNPLDTEQPEPGSTFFNTVGVRNYDDYQQGLDATVATFKNGFNDRVIGALRDHASAETVTQALRANSSWSTAGDLYLETLPRTEENFVSLSEEAIPGYSRQATPTAPTDPVKPPAPVAPPTPVNQTPPEEAAVESAISAQTAEVKDQTAEGKVSKAKETLAKLKVHFQELEDLLK